MYGIAWHGYAQGEPHEVYTGPSWSWAGYNGIAESMTINRPCREVSAIESWHIKLKNESNPFGEVEEAWIKIYGPVTSLTISFESGTRDENHRQRRGVSIDEPPYFHTPYSKKEQGEWLNFDYGRDNMHELLRSEWKVIILIQYENSETLTRNEVENHGDPRIDFYGLVIRKAAGERSHEKWERAGYMRYIDLREGMEIICGKGNWQTVTLV